MHLNVSVPSLCAFQNLPLNSATTVLDNCNRCNEPSERIRILFSKCENIENYRGTAAMKNNRGNDK